ncbi:uncharacterized protein TEOVI_000860300 [Trypanosoma equiperdum]|uniref:Uncharacterized protein n=2 Tax=Trypanozoon TaxID=39700 RepID=Q381X1_TRYB2|nr:hypothetical protein, conserved [Trypanosoma brucei brucei TREU927]EAN80410.1 hypothetical protein, conserved [Trypanosoma brucei brucei TREU927]SCU67803.1 hypothetical protein, conserved [Trypanosoma equiperdum]
MPLGLDDIILVVASASPLLWLKRRDLFSSSVPRRTLTASGGVSSPQTPVRRSQTTPCILLPGIKSDRTRGIKNGAEETLVSSSVVEKYSKEIIHEYPCVPHRRVHYARHNRTSATELLTCSSEEIAATLNRYSVAEVCRLHEAIELEGDWEAALTITEGAKSGGHFAYLIKRNLESVVRTLLATGHTKMAVDYCVKYAQEVLLSDDVLVSLFDVCRNSEKESLDLYGSVQPFKSEWTPVVYACCLTVAARFKWQEALVVYHDYTKRGCQLQQSRMARLLSQVAERGGVILRPREVHVGGTLAPPVTKPLKFLYHILVPLVADRQPEKLEQFYRTMMADEPESAVDVLLRCLHTNNGRQLALHWLRESTQASTSDVPSLPCSDDVVAVANALYSKKPTTMNLNSLLNVLAHQNPASLPSHVGDRLYQQLCDATMADTDAYVLARTVSNRPGHWQLAARFMSAMVARKQFHALPLLSSYVAHQGRWALAAKAMAVCLSNRGPFTTNNLQLCVQSSVYAGRWRSALFWMERAHTGGVKLEAGVYNDALAAASRSPWVSALRAVTAMHEAEGVPSSDAILDVLESVGAQGQVEKALHVVCATGNVFWTP